MPSPRNPYAAAVPFAGMVVRELRWRLLPAAFLAVVGAFTEGAGVLLIVPLLGSIGLVVHQGGTGGLAAVIERGFALAGLEPTLGVVLVLYLLVSAAHALLYRASLLVNPALEQQFGLALRTRFYAAVVSARWPFVTTRRLADFVHATTTEIDRVGNAANQLLAVMAGLAITAVYVAIAFRLSAPLTILVGAAGLVLLWISRHRTRQSTEKGDQYLEETRRQFRLTSESLQGLKLAKTFGTQARDVEAFAAGARRRARAYMEIVRAFARSKATLDLSSALLVCGLLYVAVRGLQITGATLLLLVYVFSRIMPRVLSLQASAETIFANLPSWRAVVEQIEACEAEAERLPSNGHARAVVRRGISLDRVVYAHASGGEATLKGISLSIPAGATTAIVGASGAGKSTLADLLIGLLLPTSGSVLVDGQPLTDAGLPAWRRSIGYVPQDGFLFHDSIRRNLAWVKPAATEAEMWVALERAEAAGFVRSRPEGLDAIVGDQGVRLSGGERQRLALARALLTNPDVLVLDEATSALDSVNERQILNTLQHLAGSITIVLITHRLAAIRHADLIHVLDNGQLVESGQWTALAARGGRFAALLHAQAGEYDVSPAAVR
jgi:ATP-binding cassette subfamily C protein